MSEAKRLVDWDPRGAHYTVTVGLLKIASLGLEHGGPDNVKLAVDALHRTRASGSARSLRWWLRRYAPHIRTLIESGSSADLAALAGSDPEGWRDAFVAALPNATGADRANLLESISRFGNRETAVALADVAGSDIAEVRRHLIVRQAPKLYIRSFGTLELHRGSWSGPPLMIDRKRTRTLLGLLVAYADTTLTRDMVLDIMWPDSDPGAALNSLNQTVFQLRRSIDAEYRDGESPMYVISTADVVQLNPELAHTDLQEFRRHAARHQQGGKSDASALVALVRGEFLADLKYEDWATHVQTAVHSEVRDVLLPVATGNASVSADLAIRAACALVELDAFDEAAHIAMATQLSAAGKRVVARQTLLRFAQRLKDDLAEPASVELQDAMASMGISS